jgi:transcriptional regulator with XRE-family HTH domain
MNGAELAISQAGETVQRVLRAMFQPSGSQESAAETGEAMRKPKPAPEAPAVDPSLRAGPKLAQARELKGFSLDEIAAKTHVRRDYLEALEAMNMKLLPGKAYAIAYLKSYCKVLGLDPDALVAQFQDESALTREDARPQLRNPESKPGRERPWLAAAAIALLAAGFVGWAAWKAQNHTDPRLQTADSRTAPAPVSPPVTASAPEAPSAVVEIKALTEAWLEVRGPDGTIFLSRTLEPGDRYRPEVGAGWTLHAKDGGAFEVSIDGQQIGALGEAGAPVLGRRVDTIASSVSIVAKPGMARPPAAPIASPSVAAPNLAATAAPAVIAPAPVKKPVALDADPLDPA